MYSFIYLYITNISIGS